VARIGHAAGRLLALLVVVTVAALSTATAAAAHATFTGSEPEAGTLLRTAPDEVVLHFSDPIQDDISEVTVTAPDGERFTDAVNFATVIRVNVDTSARGVYTVEWRTTSSLDGHTIEGDFAFTVDPAPQVVEPETEPGEGSEGTPAPSEPRADDEAGQPGETGEGPGEATSPPSAGSDLDDTQGDVAGDGRTSALSLLTGVGRTLEYVGWLAVLGWSTLGGLARRLDLEWLPRRLPIWLAVGAVGAVVAVTGELARIGGGDVSQGAALFLPTPGGRARLFRLVVAGLAVLTAVAAARGGRHGVDARRTRVWAALLAIAGLTGVAASGHAASNVGYLVAGAGHLVAAGVWAGTPVAMAVDRPPGGWRGESGLRLLRAYAPAALAAFAATVLLGSVRAVQELASASDLWGSGYGRTLGLKILLVVAMVPLSLLAWRRSRPHLGLEATLVVAVAILAAVLATSTPPARVAEVAAADREAPAAVGGADAGMQDSAVNDEEPGPLGPGRPTDGDLTLAQGAGTTVVGLTVRPGQPDDEVFVTLVPADGLDAAADLDVSVAAAGHGVLPVRRCGDACHRTTLPLEGGEHLRVDVSGGAASASTTFTLPDLSAPDATARFTAADERMRGLSSFRYDEVFGPHEPPTLSTWDIIAPDRLRGVITRGDDHHEIVRIGNRTWRREGADGPWEGGEQTRLTVRANRFAWDDQRIVAPRVVGSEVVDGVTTSEISFFAQQRQLPIWYRLWVDDDDLVRQVEMRTQGHFMDQRYHDFDGAIQIRPPT
jgi:methionine-rich copper-binding protein CopC/putative copper export protein